MIAPEGLTPERREAYERLERRGAVTPIGGGMDDPRVVAPQTITAADLMNKTFREPRWAVPGIVAEGLTILVGAPKLGKSWLVLNIAIAVASGGVAIGSIPVEAGDVLYAALEDTQRRLQERLAMLLDGDPPTRLHLATEWPGLADGGIDHLDAWLDQHPEARLVIIDTFQRMRGPSGGDRNLYANDYHHVGELKRLADAHQVAVVVVHHTRKASAEDPLDMVSGTAGLAGAADTVAVIKREIGRADAALYIRGRDVPEADHALAFDPDDCAWSLLGDAREVRMSTERREIVDLLTGAPEPLAPKTIADMLGKKPGAVRKLLYTMAKAGEVDALGGCYRLPLLAGNTGNTGNTSLVSPERRGESTASGVTGPNTTGNTSIRAVTGVTRESRNGNDPSRPNIPERQGVLEGVTAVTEGSGSHQVVTREDILDAIWEAD